MIIENLQYSILSQGENQPERLPREGEVFGLFVRKLGESRAEEPSTETATITAESVDMLGPFAHVVGMGKTESIEEELRCNARFDVEREFPKNTPIGEVTFNLITEG